MSLELVYLFDVDNTLLDHDRVTADLKRHLESTVGATQARRYWEIFETIRGGAGICRLLGISAAVSGGVSG